MKLRAKVIQLPEQEARKYIASNLTIIKSKLAGRVIEPSMLNRKMGLCKKRWRFFIDTIQKEFGIKMLKIHSFGLRELNNKETAGRLFHLIMIDEGERVQGEKENARQVS